MEAGRGPSQVMDLTFAWDDGAWREGFVYAGEVSPYRQRRHASGHASGYNYLAHAGVCADRLAAVRVASPHSARGDGYVSRLLPAATGTVPPHP